MIVKVVQTRTGPRAYCGKYIIKIPHTQRDFGAKHCRWCDELFRLNSGNQKSCYFCSRKEHLTRLGKIKNPGVGKGQANKSMWDSPFYTTGIKAYRRLIGSFCERCNSTENLCVHHKDGNRWNNVRGNHETLCKKCHIAEHITRGDMPQLERGKTVTEEHRKNLRQAWLRRKEKFYG